MKSPVAHAMLGFKSARRAWETKHPRRDWTRHKEETLRRAARTRRARASRTGSARPSETWLFEAQPVVHVLEARHEDHGGLERIRGKLARFAYLIGASDSWTWPGRAYEVGLAIEHHVLRVILPLCDPATPWLPDESGTTWRLDLGVPEPCDTRKTRFTAWLTQVAVRGRMIYPEWSHGCVACMAAMACERQRYWDMVELEQDGRCSLDDDDMANLEHSRRQRLWASRALVRRVARAMCRVQRRWRQRLFAVVRCARLAQRAWLARAYAEDGIMRRRDLDAFEHEWRAFLLPSQA